MKPVKTKVDSNVYSIWKSVFNSIDRRLFDYLDDIVDNSYMNIHFTSVTELVLNNAYQNIKP